MDSLGPLILLVLFLFIMVQVAIARWIFRINEIVRLLRQIRDGVKVT